MELDRAPVPSEENARIFREMEPLFLHFWSSLKAIAIGSKEPQMCLYGDDPDDIDHCVVVFAMPSGAMGFSVHQDGNPAVQREYVKSLLGPTYFAQVEPHITRGPEEVTPENIAEVLDRIKEKMLQHLRGECGCKDHDTAEKKEPEQTEMPLWVTTLMTQEETTDA